MSTVPMTPRGLELLRARLKQLREVERPKNVRDIEEAMAHGDLRENAEYHAAKDRQGHIDGQMKWAENQLASAEVIDPKTLSGDRVMFGATVTLIDSDEPDAPPIRYQIVGEAESDLASGRISYNSPIARAMMAKEEGDEVTIISPSGRRKVIIDEVEYI